MADQKKINRILASDGIEYEINAKYWGGHETSNIKTINGESIFGKGDITITLPSALKYCGITTTQLEDGSTDNPVIIDGNEHLASTGCVVFYEDKEFVFNANSKWELFGAEETYKVVQNAISSPDVDGDATAFIDTISQDANGVITATKKNIPTATTSDDGIVKLVTGDMNGKSHVDGQAASLNHTHSQYVDLDTFGSVIEENDEVIAASLNDLNNDIQTMLDMKVTSDWNARKDEDGYIKNKPFGYEVCVKINEYNKPFYTLTNQSIYIYYNGIYHKLKVGDNVFDSLLKLNVSMDENGKYVVTCTKSPYSSLNISILAVRTIDSIYLPELVMVDADTIMTENDIDLMWDYYFESGSYYSGSYIALDDIINSIGVGDYDEDGGETENTTGA